MLKPQAQRVVTKHMFTDFSKCQFLVLDDLNITDIENGAFSSMPELKTIFIWNNNIKHLRPGMFDGVSQKVDFLYLDNNGIVNVEIGTFRNLKNLQTLDLSHNPDLNDLSPDTFIGLGKVHRLDMVYSNIKVTPGLFQHMPELQALGLSGNPYKFTPRMWEGNTKIQDLHLSNSGITQLTRPMWDGLENSMSVLSVSENSIITIKSHTFDGVNALMYLNLANCGLQRIESLAFEGARDLNHIRLEGNPLFSLDSNMFGQNIINRFDWKAYRLNFDPEFVHCDGLCWMKPWIKDQVIVTNLDEQPTKCDNLNKTAVQYLEDDCN